MGYNVVNANHIQELIDVNEDKAETLASKVNYLVDQEARHAARYLMDEMYEIVEEAVREGVMENLPDGLTNLTHEQADTLQEYIKIDMEFDTLDYFRSM